MRTRTAEAEFLAPWGEQAKEAGLLGTFTDPGGAGATLGSTGGRLGGTTAVGPTRLAPDGTGVVIQYAQGVTTVVLERI